MYRLTGDERYLQPIIYDLLVTSERLREDLANLHDSAFVARRCSELRADLNPKTRKGRLRKEMFDRAGTIDFHLNLLAGAHKMFDLGVSGEQRFVPLFDSALAACRRADLGAFLLDTAVIRVYAPQAINFIHYIYDLGLGDLRQQYMGAFRRVFADQADADLPEEDFTMKIYGLTHFITAASRYYQRPVDSSAHAWITGYLATNLNRILRETKADVVAEVGICFLLSGQSGHPAVVKCRDALLSDFDSEAGLIPSLRGNPDPAMAEHRNILAYMLFTWPERLHPGPRLPETTPYRDLFGASPNLEE